MKSWSAIYAWNVMAAHAAITEMLETTVTMALIIALDTTTDG